MFLFLLMICIVHANIFSTYPLVSRKLCNNEPSDRITQKCYNSLYKEEVECDSRRIESSNCLQINATLESIDGEALVELGRIVDENWSIRRISLDLTTLIGMNFTYLGAVVDEFLLPRPMWSVVVEPFNVKGPSRYVFERYSQLWDTYYRHLIERQFPNASECANSMMLVGHANCIHPGYSDVRRQYFLIHFNPIRLAAYVPMLYQDYEILEAFADATDCPLEHKNRWTCAFLQMTNCSMPKNDSLYTKSLDLFNTSVIGLTHFNARNHLEAVVSSNKKLMTTKKQFEAMTMELPTFVYTSPFSHAANMFKFHGPDEHQVAEFLFMEFLFRKTALYRRKVAEVLAGFRTKYGLGDAIRTKDRRFVAVHIRRSDRMVMGVNMTEFCHNLLVQRFTGVPQNCTYRDGEVKQCSGNEHVFGCDTLDDVPLGSVTLDDVVQDAEQLIGPFLRNMIIFSEDLEWLNDEVTQAIKKYPAWKFYTLDSPVRNAKHASRTVGTAAGVFFHATIDLVQECDALLGHFTSGVPMTFAGAMCHHHAGMEGICPPVYNLKNKLVRE